MIFQISPEMLQEDRLHELLYPDLGHTLYWSTHWDAAFYVQLARAGFISISTTHPDHGPILLAELQAAYAVLDWENLHRSSQIRRLARSGVLEEEQIELRITGACERIVERLLEYHRPRTWLTAPYRKLLQEIPSGDDAHFGLQAVELWSHKQNMLVAGELGYTIGRTYTSLSGFTTRPARQWRHFGTLQLVMLAERLQSRGYAFWNMGHTSQDYKLALGARILPRAEFLTRWLEATRAENSHDPDHRLRTSMPRLPIG